MKPNYNIPKLILILILCGLGNRAFASHMMGADMNYTSLGGGKYKITANVYRDCRGIAFSGPSFGVFAGTNGGNGCGANSLSGLSRTSITEVTNLCRRASALCNPQNTNGTGEGVEKHTYEATVDFGASPLSGYVNKSSCCEVTFYLGQCCRTGSITTGSAGNDFWVTCTINICNLSKCTNKEAKGPVMTIQPPSSVCCNAPMYHNPGFRDTADNDSLAFALVPGLSSLPNTSITYSSPFTYKKPATPFCVPTGSVTCTPTPYATNPRGIFLDTSNSDLIYMPTKCDEVAVIVIQAKEWRRDTSGKYVWIGKVTRDMVFRVVDDCGYNLPARLDSTYNYTVNAGKKIEFNININDKLFTPYQTKPDTISLSWNTGIPNATFTQLSDTFPNKQTATFSWQTSKKDGREYAYHFTFLTSDSACPRPMVASRAVNIRVKPVDTCWIEQVQTNCNALKLTAGLGKLNYGTNTISWTIQDSASGKTIYTGSGATVTTGQLGSGIYKLLLQVKNSVFYFEDAIKYIHFDSTVPAVILVKDTGICPYSSYKAVASVSNYTSPVKFKWFVNGGFNSRDTLTNLDLGFVFQDQSLVFQLTDAHNCNISSTQKVSVFKDPMTAWKKKSYAICHDTTNILLNNLVNVGDSVNAVFSCSNPVLFQKTGTKNYFLPGMIDNNTLNNGQYLQVKLYCSFTSAHGCFSKDSATIRVNGNPVVELTDKDLCQDMGKANMDSFVIRPKTKFGTVRTWRVLTAPAGVNKSTLITQSSGIDYFNFGTKYDPSYAGTYTFEFRVTDQVTACYRRDTNTVKVINEAAISYASLNYCDNQPELSLLENVLLNGKKSPAPPASSFHIRSFNYNPNDAKVSSTTLKNGYLFPTGTAGIGRWGLDFTAIADGCPVGDSFVIYVNPSPNAGFTASPSDSAPVNNPKFTTVNNSNISSGTLTYFWYFGTGNNKDTSVSANPTITYPSKNAWYDVMLVAKSNWGCRDTFYQRLQVGQGNLAVAIPQYKNAWIDNTFRITGLEFKSMETRIFDVSGRQVAAFENNVGVELPTGVYYYRIHLVMENGKENMLKGAVQISR